MSIQIPNVWTFDSEPIASNFDNHVREQLPFYDLVSQAIVDLVALYVERQGAVVDIGASTGNIAKRLNALLVTRDAKCVSIEQSDSMARIWNAPGELVHANVLDVDLPPANAVVSNLTFMFVPPSERRQLLAKILASLTDNGALILVERFESQYGAMANRHLIQAAKFRSGTPLNDVLSKEVSLAGVLRPLDYGLLEPYKHWQFFAYGDFRGYVVERPNG